MTQVFPLSLITYEYLKVNRCQICISRFYEWKKDGSKKQPYYVHFKDARRLLFAALYDSWENSEGEKLYTFTIITTSSSSALGGSMMSPACSFSFMFLCVLLQMLVILGDKESIDTWLNDSSSSYFDKLLKPYEGSDLQQGIGGEVVPHQDNSFLYTEPQTCTCMWLTLEDATVVNGCLWAIPGSQKDGLVRWFIRGEDGVTFDRPSPAPA
ncbi:putative phytanoyl-CoA dioxygenase [Rosa chinensis]|uniref:Putative phytanoyl-CoA dioxygenase n=1 Tax=Rosa chinensis TaxID=74649 RepID=A0A2P6PTW9_ROSCH|nr:putative phytanoyl-CoA dioxygenase [Rosa chinensis]